jgi:tight adherence protein B
MWALIPMAIPGILFFWDSRKEIIRRDRELLEAQFCECIEAVGTAVRTGASVETAFLGSYSTMVTLFGEDSMICEELRSIRRGLARNVTLENLLRNFAERSGSDAISRFAGVFSIVKRNGGGMEEIIQGSAELIRIRQDSRREMRALLGGRRSEMQIMRCMPFLIVFYVGLGQPEYFLPLYGNLRGVLIMTGMLALYLLAYYLGERTLAKLEGEV